MRDAPAAAVIAIAGVAVEAVPAAEVGALAAVREATVVATRAAVDAEDDDRK